MNSRKARLPEIIDILAHQVISSQEELSKQLDETMSKLNLGKVIGGAMGKSFSYIDWIIFDLEGFEKAFEQIKKKLDPKVELHFQTFQETMN